MKDLLDNLALGDRQRKLEPGQPVVSRDLCLTHLTHANLSQGFILRLTSYSLGDWEARHTSKRRSDSTAKLVNIPCSKALRSSSRQSLSLPSVGASSTTLSNKSQCSLDAVLGRLLD